MPFLSFLSSLMPFCLLLGGLFAGVGLRFFPFLHPLRTLRIMRGQGKGENASAFRATCMALAGTVGVGNMTGVALAILGGGPGAVFWMWACAFAAMLLKYAEITLSMAHRPAEGEGGTPYTMKALGLLRSAGLFALLCLFYTLLVGGAVQANAVSACFADSFAVPTPITGILLIFFALPPILGGGKRIAALTEKLVPPMCLFYVGAALLVILCHASALPGVLASIWQGAFSPVAAGGGVLGFMFSAALRTGASRGLMSNEGGCGTSPLAHVTSGEKIPGRQGLFGIVEVFVDTSLICTLTAFALLSVFPTLPEGVGGAALLRMAFAAVFGQAAGGILGVLLFFFAYATILCQAFYGQACLSYFTKDKRARRWFSALFCLALFFGAVGTPAFVWAACDGILAIMTLCNLLLLWRGRKEVVALTKEAGLLD